MGATAIPKATEADGVRTCGVGTVTLQVVDSSNRLVDALDDDGNPVTVSVLNWSLEDSGTNTYVWIAMSLMDGQLYYVNEPC